MGLGASSFLEGEYGLKVTLLNLWGSYGPTPRPIVTDFRDKKSERCVGGRGSWVCILRDTPGA